MKNSLIFYLGGGWKLIRGKGEGWGLVVGGGMFVEYILEMVGAVYISFGSICICSILVMFLVIFIICLEMMKFVIVCVNKWVLDLNKYFF